MNRKAIPIFYEGNKILRISDLPSSQFVLFSGWLTPSHFLTLGETTDYDCVSYDDYEHWYQYHYITEKEADNIL
ncbi:MAG: hypothetical protein JXR10_12525 [Cyclobacteriaceae bacterium]